MFSVFAWYFLSFKGRIGRREFWLGYVGLIAVMMALWRPLEELSLNALRPLSRPWYRPELELAYALASFVMVGIMLWPMLAIFAKRLHDANLSAWWLLTPLLLSVAMAQANLPAGSLVWLGIALLGVLPGSKGGNRFGADPLARP